MARWTLQPNVRYRTLRTFRQRIRPIRAACVPAPLPRPTFCDRTFETDILALPDCGGRLRLLATIEDTEVIRKVLIHSAELRY